MPALTKKVISPARRRQAVEQVQKELDVPERRARWTQLGAALTAKARTSWLSRSWQHLSLLPLAA